MKKISKILILSVIFALALSSVSLAGSWKTQSFSKNILMNSEYITTPVTVTGDPSIDFTAYGATYGDRITVKMQKWSYSSDPNIGWHYKTVSEKTVMVSSTGAAYGMPIGLSDGSVYFAEDKCQFVISSSSYRTITVKGKVTYFQY